MRETRTCSECGKALADDAPEGFCPGCMLEGALGLGFAETAPLESGAKRFGDYELLEEIARGGMGVVYRARQVSLDRIVAVKLVLFGKHASEASLARFRAEAAAVARLRHPNIVAIHEVGEKEGQPYFSMDYVEGRNLEEYAREHPFTARQAAQLVRTIAGAIHYAHEQGIVHRDLKPANILIDAAVEPHITDFGLAKNLETSQPSTLNPQLTLSGQVLGSPSFLPPEQASGKRGPIGRHTDVYALGAVLYYLLTGRPPFVGETITDTLQQVLNEEPVEPRLLNRGVPRDLETICLKCMEKEPEKRYGTAEELGEELNRFLSGEPILARPVGAPARVWRWCRRKPVVAGLSGAVVLSVVLGFMGVSWEWRQSEQHRVLAEQNAESSERHRVLAEKNAEASRRNLYAADMLLAQGALEAENVGHAAEILRRYWPEKGQKDLRGWEWYYAWDQCRTEELFTLEAPNSESLSSLALSPDDSLLAAGSLSGRVIIWDLTARKAKHILHFERGVSAMAFRKTQAELVIGTTDGELSLWSNERGQRRCELPKRSRVRSLAISPDGKTLAVYSRFSVCLVDLETNRQFASLRLLPNDENLPGGVAFSPDSKSLAYCRGDGRIVLRSLPEGEEIALLKGHANYVTSLAFSPDGKLLYSGSRDRTIRVWKVEMGQELRNIGPFAGFVSCLSLSPDGEILAVAGAGQTLKLFDTESWEEIASCRGHTREIGGTVFTSDGQTVLTCSHDGTIKAWPVHRPPDPAVQRFPDAQSVLLSAGGKFIYVMHTNHTYSVWRSYPREEILRSPYPVTGRFTSSALSPDGSLWAVAPTGEVVKVFHNPETRDAQPRLVDELSMPGVAVSRLVFSSDGRRLAGFQQRDGTCRVWQCARESSPQAAESSFREIATLKFQHYQPLLSLSFSGNGDLLCAGFSAGLAEVWQVSSGAKLGVLIGDTWGVADVQACRDHTTVATASGSGKIRLWDVRSRSETAVLGGQLSSLLSVAFSPDESRIAACGGDGTVRIWDMETRNPVATLKLHWERLSHLVFRDDETLVVAASDRCFVLRAPQDPVHLRPDTSSLVRWGLSTPQGEVRGAGDADSFREAGAENVSLLGLLPRAKDTPTNLIDLSPFYNLSLAGIKSWQCEVESEQNPQQGRRHFGDVDFDVRGAIRLASPNPGYIGIICPRRVTGIPVGLKLQKLHFLHSVFGPEREGTAVASYVANYADGEVVEIPVKYGEDLRTWGPADREAQLRSPNSSLAWSGTNSLSQPGRLFQTAWENPRPQVEIKTIDFVSLLTQSMPVLVAITADL